MNVSPKKTDPAEVIPTPFKTEGNIDGQSVSFQSISSQDPPTHHDAVAQNQTIKSNLETPSIVNSSSLKTEDLPPRADPISNKEQMAKTEVKEEKQEEEEYEGTFQLRPVIQEKKEEEYEGTFQLRPANQDKDSGKVSAKSEMELNKAAYLNLKLKISFVSIEDAIGHNNMEMWV